MRAYKNHYGEFTPAALDIAKLLEDEPSAQPPAPADEHIMLERYGLKWTGPKDFVPKPMPDGYWTPWHVANALLMAAQSPAPTDEQIVRAYNAWLSHPDTIDINADDYPTFYAGYRAALQEREG